MMQFWMLLEVTLPFQATGKPPNIFSNLNGLGFRVQGFQGLGSVWSKEDGQQHGKWSHVGMSGDM